MAWTYFCANDRMTLSAPNKEQLADKMIEHMQQKHNTSMSRDEAMKQVNQHAKQAAA